MDNKMRPSSLSSRSNFFSSLKQVEKRLKLDHTSPPPTESQSYLLSNGSLSSPMFLNLDQPSCTEISGTQDSSEPPQAFLSISQEFTPTYQQPFQTSPSHHLTTVNKAQDNIDQLIQLLGLSEGQSDGLEDGNDGNSCHCEDGFYSKVVGVEGPKCGKEVKRLDGRIKNFLNGGGEEKLEPLRLAQLLLGKAAFISEGDDGGFGGLEFLSTIQEFLHTDPPSN